MASSLLLNVNINLSHNAQISFTTSPSSTFTTFNPYSNVITKCVNKPSLLFQNVQHQKSKLKNKFFFEATMSSNEKIELNSSSTGTTWFQKTIQLKPYKRGCHIITHEIKKSIPELSQFKIGLAHIFILHTSASLTINENASHDVPIDMENTLNKIVPEGNFYQHLDEGYDDMPAHVKSSLMGNSLTIPISHGRLTLGTWQGIWLNEHRNYGGSRSLCITIQGEKRNDGRSYK